MGDNEECADHVGDHRGDGNARNSQMESDHKKQV